MARSHWWICPACGSAAPWNDPFNCHPLDGCGPALALTSLGSGVPPHAYGATPEGPPTGRKTKESRMTSIIYRRIPTCDPALVAEAAKISVADLHESMNVIPGRMALMDGSIRPLNPGLRIAGQAVTAYCFPGDGLLAHKAVSMVGPGQILVFANGGSG